MRDSISLKNYSGFNKVFFCVNVSSVFTALIVFPLLKISLQFFKRNSDIFSFSDACGWVSLKNAGENSSGRASTQREEHRALESESAQSSVVVDERKPLSLARYVFMSPVICTTLHVHHTFFLHFFAVFARLRLENA